MGRKLFETSFVFYFYIENRSDSKSENNYCIKELQQRFFFSYAWYDNDV